MRVVGIDLAGSENNDTGLCALIGDPNEKRVKTSLLKKDEDILLQTALLEPDLVAIDAPLSWATNAYMRPSDQELYEYGRLPQNLRGMRCLVERGVALGQKLKAEYKVIEVFPAASAKILGFYAKDDTQYQKNLINLGLGGDLKSHILKRDELDAIAAALTGYLHLQGKTNEVGDEQGKIVVPRV